ncbi:hypothetical protein TTHERM_00522010 (macronuclear) [Tetrahymena thermophila SB210]|uniref:Uncharacterized protein n=1 Tax=Tetrahymena thermophila (strain SB210) TaxID=312017 RepID=I7M7K7_TETTS|nr:hypothetical protein TTHERM_00522010 [Tetrahymena thermophila SB210]EAR94134.4 hypothetical protein TTHERM_00522010 [Tetrahymena thermophila SB210]|eukprot:XP_001014379.4 hypothetical protein TTHERM_00522010 [Tetrahymena thermophila SB210]
MQRNLEKKQIFCIKMPRKRRQQQGQRKSKSQDPIQEQSKIKLPVQQKRVSGIQDGKNKILSGDLEETIFYDETSSQQVFNRDDSKSVNQQSQSASMSINAMNKSSNIIKISTNSTSRKTRNSLTITKKNTEKENEPIIDEEDIYKESYQESNTESQLLRNQEKLKKIFSTENNQIQLKENYDSQLIDHEHFEQLKNKGISKYGNKKGRKKAHEKDHYLPLEDKELMDELHQILLDYEYNFRNKSQNNSLLFKQETSFDSQNIVKKELEQSGQFDCQIADQSMQHQQLILSNYFNDQSNQENKEINITNNNNLLIKFESQSCSDFKQPIYNQNINQIQLTGNQNTQNLGDLSNIHDLNKSNNNFPNLSKNKSQCLQGRDLNNQNPQLSNKIKKFSIENQNSISADSQNHVLIFNKYKQNVLDNTKQQSQETQESFNQKTEQQNVQNKTFSDSLSQDISIFRQKVSLGNSQLSNQGIIDESVQKNSSQMVDEDAETISTPTLKILQQLEQQVQLQKIAKNKNSNESKQSRSYKLAEDIKIIYVMSQKKNTINGYSSKYWGLVVRLNLIQRPHESLRDRYKRFIKYLNRDNIIDIIKWVRKNDKIEGYLNFIKFKNNFKLFSHVSFEDPFASKKQLFSGHRVQDARKNKSVSLESQSQNDSDEYSSVKKEEKQEGKAELNSEHQIQQQQNTRSEYQSNLFCSDFNLNENLNYFQQKQNKNSFLNVNRQQQYSPKKINNRKREGSNKNDLVKGCHSPSTQQNSQMSVYSPETNLKNETYSFQNVNQQVVNNSLSNQKKEEGNIFEISNFQFNQSCYIDGESKLYIILSEADSDEDLYNEAYLKDTDQILLKQDMNDMSQQQNINENEVVNNQNQILPPNIMGGNSMNSLEGEIIKKEEEQNCEQESNFVNDERFINKQSFTQDQILDQQQVFQQHQNYQIQHSNQKESPYEMNESFNSRCHIQEIEQLNRCDYYNNENDSNSFQQLYNKMVSQNNELNVQSKDFHSMDIELDQSQILL